MNRIVAIHQGAIGDFLLALSVLQAVRGLVPDGRLTVIATAPSARLAAGRSIVDAYRAPDEVGLYGLFGDGLDVDERLRQLLCDAQYIIHWLGDVRCDVHRRLEALTDARIYAVDPNPQEETLRQRIHVTEQWCGDLRQQGLSVGPPTPAMIRLEDGQRSTDAGVLIHPGSGGLRKCWPLERFMAVADRFEGGPVRWMLGPAELEMNPHLDEAIRARGEECIVSDFVSVAGHIARSRLYLGNDSGMSHLAAAVSTATVAIFGPTDPRVWRPLGEQVRCVEPDREGECVDVDRVWKMIEEGRIES